MAIDRSYPPLKTHKLYSGAQISLRVLAIAATLAAALLMFFSKQATTVYGIQVDARYTYSPAFEFLAIANIIVLAFTIISLVFAFVMGRGGVDPARYFYLFLHDLIMAVVLMAASVAATAIGYVGKYGNSHTGWIAICDHFPKFCNRATLSALFSYLAFIFYLVLTIISANISRQIVQD